MALATGARLGPYEILAPIGAGGMGEVYRAKDTRLDRTVAVKVLPPHLASNPDLRQRFEREARAVSSLNHPHICVLHDVGNQDGVDFLVMEYIEGETLSARLAKGPLETAQVIELGIQIAWALAQAHKQGIFHRDLKPGNIMLTASGAKLLDFGLAKFRAPAGVAGAATLSMLPTQAEGLTQKGTILGTFQYMSPEQIEGKDTDGRADIFAFGAVLYEMATGKKAFEGKSHAGVMAAILEREPEPISTVQPATPPGLNRLIRRCLAKDPDQRWQSAGDVKLELQWVAESGTAPAAVQPVSSAAEPLVPQRRGVLGRLAWPAAAVFFLAAVALAVIHFREVPPEQRVMRFFVAPPEKASIHTFAISPDGRYLALAATTTDNKRSLWVRALDTLEAQPLPGTEDAQYPFWSPDGRYIAFFAGGKLKKVAATGGPPQALCDAADGRGGAWNRDGVIVFAPNPSSVIYRVSSAGGVPAAVTSLETNGGGGIHRFPSFLPDGRHFFYLVSRAPADKNGLYVASLDSKDARRLLADLSSAVYAPGPAPQAGHLLFIRDKTLAAQPFDPAKVQFTGELFPVAENIGFQNLNYAEFALSSSGTLAYLTGRATFYNQLTWFDRNGKQLGAATEAGAQANFALSPDAKRVAVERIDRSGTADIWLLELARGTASRFTFDATNEVVPLWSPDGGRIAFAANPGGKFEIYQKVSTGAGKDELLLKMPSSIAAVDWSRDGRFLVYTIADPKTKWDLWLLPLEGERKPVPFLQTQFNEMEAQFSPDGRWMAYSADESGRFEVYVQPIPPSGGKWQISTAGGYQPRWRRDGKELFYLAADRKLMSVAVKAGTSFEAGVPQALFETRSLPFLTTLPRTWDVTADGQRFLINTTLADQAQTPLTVVVNWQQGVKK